MGIIDDNRLKRKDQDKPLGSFGPRDEPKDISTDTTASINKKKEDRNNQ